MKKLIVIFAVFLIFGCIDFGDGNGPDEEPEDNKTVVVVVEPEENETVVINVSDGEEPEDNETEEWEGINYTYDASAKMGVYFIDVCDYSTGNHSSSILIKKGDFDMLVDGGSDATYGEVIDFLKARGVDDIEVLVSTTGDSRRYGGLPEVADEFEVEEFWWSGLEFSQEHREVIQDVSSKAKETRVLRRGDTRELNGIEFEVINPKETDYFDDVNNDALVLSVEDRYLTLLLLSNIQTGAQGDLINNMENEIKADVIEAPYYGVGEGTAHIGLFLQKSDPDYVVIGGCSDETLEVEGTTRNPFKRLMDQYGIEYYEAYEAESIKITSDDTGYAFTVEE